MFMVLAVERCNAAGLVVGMPQDDIPFSMSASYPPPTFCAVDNDSAYKWPHR